MSLKPLLKVWAVLVSLGASLYSSLPCASAQNTPTLQAPPSPPTKLCPLTGKPPSKPSGPLARCSGDEGLSCCSTCQSAGASLALLGSNGSTLFGFLQDVPPVLGGLVADVSPTLEQVFKEQTCNLFSGSPGCLQLIETVYCAMACDPDAGNYLSMGPDGNASLDLCSSFSTLVQTKCTSGMMPALNSTISLFANTPLDWFNTMMSPILQMMTGVQSLTAVEGGPLASCFHREPSLQGSLCCDPMSDVPSSCLLPGSRVLVNRTLPSSCPPPSPPPPPASPYPPPDPVWSMSMSSSGNSPAFTDPKLPTLQATTGFRSWNPYVQWSWTILVLAWTFHMF